MDSGKGQWVKDIPDSSLENHPALNLPPPPPPTPCRVGKPKTKQGRSRSTELGTEGQRQLAKKTLLPPKPLLFQQRTKPSRHSRALFACREPSLPFLAGPPAGQPAAPRGQPGYQPGRGGERPPPSPRLGAFDPRRAGR